MPEFVPMWNNHPNIKGDTPVLDKRTYENQCAINMSVAWLRSGMKLNVLFHKRGNEIITVIVIRLIINDARLFGAITSALKFNRS